MIQNFIWYNRVSNANVPQMQPTSRHVLTNVRMITMANLSIPRTSGIYKITCTANSKIYVGSAVNLYQRWNRHRSELRTNKHTNPHLQSAWNKYGEQSFIFEVLELVALQSRLGHEQYWLDVLKPYDREIGFNMALDASSPMKGRKASIETREKLRQLHLGKPKSPEAIELSASKRRGRKIPDDQKEKMRQAKLGKKASPETRAKLSAIRKGRKLSVKVIHPSRRKDYIVTDPNGVERLVNGITLFCKENNLNTTVMIRIARGRQDNHKGWKCRYYNNTTP